MSLFLGLTDPPHSHPRNKQSSQNWSDSILASLAPNCTLFSPNPGKMGPEIISVFQPKPYTCSHLVLSPPSQHEGLAGPSLPHTHLVREGFKACSHRVLTAKFGGLKASDDVLQRCSHHKVLLFQPQLLAFKELMQGDAQTSALQLPSLVGSPTLGDAPI